MGKVLGHICGVLFSFVLSNAGGPLHATEGPGIRLPLLLAS